VLTGKHLFRLLERGNRNHIEGKFSQDSD
jgi:hypothetical protein